jgi:hypothetical protein
MVGGAAVFGLVLALAIEPGCSSLFSDQTIERGWWPKFFCESKIGEFAILRAYERAHEGRILHRAYVSVLPKGIAPFISENGMLSCDVAFHNGGNLPATRVRWFIDRKFSTDGDLNDFPIGNDLSGSNIIPARAEMRKGAKAIRSAELDSFKKGGGPKDRWLYVWGRVAYRDGFGRNRQTDFCFGYNLAGIKDGKIAAEAARQHEYGNRTGEE